MTSSNDPLPDQAELLDEDVVEPPASDADLAEQREGAWPDEDELEDGPVPDADRPVPPEEPE
jgi:hypothetical protein